jgi:hypothetical protein
VVQSAIGLAMVAMQWVLARLRPTPFGHFTEPVRLQRADAEQPRRVYVRCLHWPNPSMDRYAANARSAPGWDYRELATPHMPYITDPDELSALLLDLSTDGSAPSTRRRGGSNAARTAGTSSTR